MNENRIEGRNAVIEAFRSGRTIDKLYMLDGSKEGAMQTVRKEAAKHGTPVKYVTKQRLDQMSETGRHQGVIAEIAAYSYGEMEDLFRKQKREERTLSLYCSTELRIPITWARSSGRRIWPALTE